MLELTGHLPRTRECLRRLAEMPHPPLRHPRELAGVQMIHLDIISDSILCIRPSPKPKSRARLSHRLPSSNPLPPAVRPSFPPSIPSSFRSPPPPPKESVFRPNP